MKRGGKGSHRNLEHPLSVNVTPSGPEGGNAKSYQEKEVRIAIAEAKAKESKS